MASIVGGGGTHVECLLGELASLLWCVVDFVVEDGVVERKAKADRVGWGHFGLGNVKGSFIRLARVVDDGLSLGFVRGNLGEVSEVVSLHLQVEHLAFWDECLGNQVLVEEVLHSLQTMGRADGTCTYARA